MPDDFTTLAANAAAMNKRENNMTTALWREYASDFNNMSDAEIEEWRNECQGLIDENQSITDAIASWEQSGRPRDE